MVASFEQDNSPDWFRDVGFMIHIGNNYWTLATIK
jgi:hypothetical protein